MENVEKLLADIENGMNAIEQKEQITTLNKMLYGLLMDCSVMLKEQQKQLEKYHEADTFLEAHGWKWEE